MSCAHRFVTYLCIDNFELKVKPKNAQRHPWVYNRHFLRTSIYCNYANVHYKLALCNVVYGLKNNNNHSAINKIIIYIIFQEYFFRYLFGKKNIFDL